MSAATILLLALVLDAMLGEPKWLWDRLPHPAVLLGRMIGGLEAKYNHGDNRKLKGIAAVLIVIAAALLVGYLWSIIPDFGLLQLALVAILLAQRSLTDHVGDVADALRLSLGDGRMMVGRIVGRDVSALDESGVARGAIESAAENLSDGVIAPAFWYIIGGLPGIIAYKAINTADSMIGYKNDRYDQFGWTAAKLDDVLNWIPARLTAALIAFSHLRFDSYKFIRRDAVLHRSPNAGWPEAAMAVVLGVALSGPRSYDGTMRDEAFVYAEGKKQLGPDDIDAAIGVLWRVWWLGLGLVVVVAVFGSG